MLYCALDPSISCTGISILECLSKDSYKVHDVGSISIKNISAHRKFERKAVMLELLEAWLEPWASRIGFVVFENYSYGSPGRLADLGELGGLYKSYFYGRDIPIDVIPPASVKKIVGGGGRASKEEVRNGVAKFLSSPAEFNNYDESDAVAVGIAYGINMLAMESAKS